MGGWIDGQMGGWTDVWMDEWADGWTDSRMDGWMERWMNRWMDEQTSICVNVHGIPFHKELEAAGKRVEQLD